MAFRSKKIEVRFQSYTLKKTKILVHFTQENWTFFHSYKIFSFKPEFLKASEFWTACDWKIYYFSAFHCVTNTLLPKRTPTI